MQGCQNFSKITRLEIEVVNIGSVIYKARPLQGRAGYVCPKRLLNSGVKFKKSWSEKKSSKIKVIFNHY